MAYCYALTRRKAFFTNHLQISRGIVSRLRNGIVTLFFIKFRWDDQKRHSIDSGIVSRFDCSADISIAFIAISQYRNDDIIDSTTVFVVPLLRGEMKSKKKCDINLFKPEFSFRLVFISSILYCIWQTNTIWNRYFDKTNLLLSVTSC